MLILITKIICLFIAILFTSSILTKTYHKNTVSAMNFVLQAAGITGFIVLQWLI